MHKLLVLLLVFIVFYVIWETLSFIWRKLHPKYDITFIAAEIGSGKSCYAAKVAREHMRTVKDRYKKKYKKKGWTVYSNDFILGAGKINVKQLETMCAPEKSLIILDEASLEMNSRQFAKTALVLIEYFKKSRHYKNKLIMISQTFCDTDKQIRELSSKIYFIRPIFSDSFPGLISMPVRVRGKLGIGLDGQPCMQYKIGMIGMPYFLPRYYKYFDSFSKIERPIVPWEPWERKEVSDGSGDAPIGGTAESVDTELRVAST